MDEKATKNHTDHGIPAKPQNTLTRFLKNVLSGTPIACEFQLPSREVLRFGNKPPAFRIIIHNPRILNQSLDEYALAQGYIQGDIDLEGDLVRLLDLRFHLREKLRVGHALNFWKSLVFSNPVRANRKYIENHYGHGRDFYFSFLDSRYHMYSHGLFETESDSLEQASENKLRYMVESLNLQPGMRVLDIGAGWGGVVEYAGSRGIQVTALTLSQETYDFVRDLIDKKHLPCEVYLEDFLDHRPETPYDAVTNFGVIEHIPQYHRFFEKVWDCLKPGGLFYLDGSATREKYDKSDFTTQHVWPGAHTFMCLHNLIQELLYHGMDLLRVRNESHDYELTLKYWAQNLDARKDQIVQRWGEELYRAFRIYLWGGHHAFLTDQLQAYHVLARRGEDRGPRPGFLKRWILFCKERI